MPRKQGRNLENLAASRAALIAAAAREFTEYGFDKALTVSIVARAGLAQGSLYYHFKDKKSLFSAVYEHEVKLGLEYIRTHPQPTQDSPYKDLIMGCLVFLKLAENKRFRRIVLLESLNVLSYEEMTALRAKSFYGALLELIKGLKNNGNLSHIPDAEGYATALYGLICELGRSLEYAKNQGQALEFAKKTTSFFLEKTLQS